MDKLIEQLIHRYDEAKNIRSQVNPLLTELGKYVWPSMQDMVIEKAIPDEGLVRTVEIYDTTAITASKRMTSGLFSYLMPIGSKWYNYIADDYEANQVSENKEWLSKATIEAHKMIWASNYMREMYATIRSMISFGTGAISYLPKTDFRFYPLQTVFFEENANGIIDSVFRLIQYNKRQAKQFFENPGKSVANEKDDSKSLFEYIHCVVPNEDYDGKLGSQKFTSIYILLKDNEEVFEKGKKNRGGYSKQIYRIARAPRGPQGILGESQAKDLLPDIKMLNAMTEAYIKSRETQADPTICVTDDGVVGQPSTGPGGMIVMRAGSEKPFYLQSGGDPQSAYQDIMELRTIIDTGFHKNVFQALEGLKNISSATEAEIRREDSLVMLAPEVTPLTKELLDPLMLSVLEGLPEDKLPTRPPGLKVKIQYEGRLALAMSNLQGSALERWLAKWAPIQEAGIPVYDNMDIDKGSRDNALNDGVPAELLIDEDLRDNQRAAQNQKAQMERDAAMAESMSKSIKNVGSVVG